MQEFKINEPAITLQGALDIDQSPTGITPRRLPDWTRAQVPGFMEMMVTQPSGVRVNFATDSNRIELDVCLTRTQMANKPPRRAVFDLLCDGKRITSLESDSGHVLAIDLRKPGQPELIPGQPASLVFEDLPAGLHQYEIWLPTSAQVELRGLRLADTATLQAYTTQAQVRWLHHGSSISHCAEATSPTLSWPAVAAQLADMELLNLGFGGNCQLDQFVARTIRDTQTDLISLKLGINVVNMDSMRERTFTPAVHGFLDTIREGQPTTPILIVSPIFCPSAETSPGPTLPNSEGKFVTFDGDDQIRAGCLTLTWIRKILSRVVAARRAAGDLHLHYLDGLQLFGAGDAGDLPDDLHPNGTGYQRMGQRFYQLALQPDGLLSPTKFNNTAT